MSYVNKVVIFHTMNKDIKLVAKLVFCDSQGIPAGLFKGLRPLTP
jgi:hypothetical protein